MSEVTFSIPDACAKPRMTRADKWKQRSVVLEYRAFADLARLCAGKVKGQKPGVISLRFELAMPKSWSKKKQAQMGGQPHTQQPDVDNLIKAVLDAIWPDGDSFVHSVTAVKRWGQTNRTEVTVCNS